MSTVFIIHGSFGHPQENWFPWLKKELERLGHKVFVPKFPTPEGQSLQTWLETFKPYWQHITPDTIFVAHSLGPAFVLAVLERLDHPVKACFFVSGWLGLLENPKFDEINKTFVVRDFDWDKIKASCPKFFLLHSGNDPYVPLEKAQILAQSLDTKLNIIKGAGHFNETAGYKKFEALLEKIKPIL